MNDKRMKGAENMTTTTAKKQQKEKNVQPLRSKEEIEEMKQALRRWCSERDYFMFDFGINTGLRVSDILPLTVGKVRGKTQIKVKPQKTANTTGVVLDVHLPDGLQQRIAEYTKGMKDEDWLFPSRKGDKHIQPCQAYRALVKAAEMIDRDDVGTHTMRKTFGYHYYKKTKDVVKLMEIFQHSAPSITLRYIGITQEEIADSMRDFDL